MERVPKYPRTYHWPWSPQVHQDDSYHQDPTVFVGPEIVISEKYDGGNSALCEGEVYARSTGQPARQGWFAMLKKHHAHKTIGLGHDVYLYGEDIYGVHSLSYDPIREDETYYLFGVRERDVWFSWDHMVAMADMLELRHVPCLYRGTFKTVKEITEWMDSRIKEPSTIGPATEGFVIRFADGFKNEEFATKVAKYVRKGHVQTDQHWTKNWQPAKLKSD